MNKIQSRKIFVGGLDSQTSHQLLLSYFKKYGTIIDLELKKKKETDVHCLGYGIMTVENDAFNKILSYEFHKFENRKIQCKPFLKGQELTKFNLDYNNRRLYISDLPEETRDQDLKKFFSDFGQVMNAYVILDSESRRPTGKGLVLFSKAGSIDKVLSQEENLRIKGKLVKCEISKKLVQIQEKLKKKTKKNSGVGINKSRAKRRGRKPFQNCKKNCKNKRRKKIEKGQKLDRQRTEEFINEPQMRYVYSPRINEYHDYRYCPSSVAIPEQIRAVYQLNDKVGLSGYKEHRRLMISLPNKLALAESIKPNSSFYDHSLAHENHLSKNLVFRKQLAPSLKQYWRI